MSELDFQRLTNGTSSHVRSTNPKSHDADDEDKPRVKNDALTSLPPLTGLRPSACREILVVETYDSEVTFCDLQEIARRHHVVPATAFLAAWASTLAAYTGLTDDITFLTILPDIGSECQSHETPYKLCRYNAREQGCVAIDRLLLHLGKPTSNDIPGGDTVTNDQPPDKLSQVDGTVLDLQGLSRYTKECKVIKEGRPRPPTSKSAVHIKVLVSHGGTLSFEASGLDTIITRETAGLLLAQLDQSLRVINSEPGTSIDRISKSFGSKYLSISNPEPKAVTSSAPLHSQFEESARSNPQCIALDFYVSLQSQSPISNGAWTYESLNKQANTFATHLQTRFGSLIGCIVPVCLDRCPELYIAILGILKVGAAWCPIDPSFPARRRHDLVVRSGGKALVVNGQSPHDGLPTDVHPVDMSHIDWSLTETPRKPEIGPDNIAYLIWTSGTTGAPKGVPIHHGAAVASMRALQASIPSDVRPGNVRCLQFSQFTFDVFVQDLFYTWGVGGTLISADRATMLGSFAELAMKTKATHAHLTPAFAASIPRRRCPSLEVVTMIGEKLTTNVADDWSEDCRLYNTYGPAETTVVSTLRLVPPRDTIQSANVGHPLPSVSAFVMQNEEPVIKNGIGELALGGPQLSKGYWNDPTKTRERFVWNERLKTKLYLTGDIVRQLYDGSFEFVGRTDDLVKIQGIRIELSEIAFALRSCHTSVEQVDVHFLDRPDRPTKVIVAFLAAPGLEARIGDVITDEAGIEVAQSALVEAKTQLPSYMIPKVFIVVTNIPRTSSAKVDRAVIKRLYAEMDLAAWERKLGSEGHLEEQANDLRADETAVIEVVAKLTGTSKGGISRHSTLPSIGVDSITATRLATRLHAQDVHISIADILQSVTVGDLLRRLFEARAATSITGYDIVTFHKEAYKLLDALLAAKLELVIPALPLQESLLSESLRNPVSYWNHNFFVLASGTNLTTLKNAWTTVAESNDALRTAFLPVAELSGRLDTKATFLQLIHKEAISQSTDSNLRTHAKNQANKIAKHMQENKFAEPPWAVSVIVLETRRIMMLSLHHSIRDEPSLNHIMHDLQQVYYNTTRESLRQRHQLREATSLLYADSDQSEQDESFWAKSLSHFVDDEDSKSWPELKLTEQTTSDGTITYTSPDERSHKDLQAQAISIGAASVASLLRVVWGCILLEYLETDKVVFGETWSARNEASALADVIGPLISVIPVPFQVHGTLRQTIQRQATFQGRSKPHYGIHPRMVRKLLRKSENDPLYPAIFNFIPDLDEQATCGNNSLWRRMDDLVGLSVEHAIALNVFVTKDDTMKIELTANRKYMDNAHLAILARQIHALLDLTLHQPDAELSQVKNSLEINLLSVTPPNREIETNPAWTQSPTAWVDRNASLHPSWPAAEIVISFEYDKMITKTWSYEQLRRAYQNVAALIQSVGCTKRSIAVCVERSLDVYAIILAIMGTGNTYLPIVEDLPHDRKLFLLKDSEAAMLFINKSLSSSFSNISQSCRTVRIEDINYVKEIEMEKQIYSQPTDNAYLLYTSGSTGTPKGVLVSRGNLMSFIEAISHFISSHVDMPALQGNGKWLGIASYAFDVHLLEMFFTWRHGMSTVTAPRSMLLDSLELALQNLKVTHASFVPSLVDNAGLHPANLPDLRYMSLGGEKITKKAIDTWSRSHVALANAYGPTEVTIGCSFQRVKPDTNVRNIGFPLSYTVAHILQFGSEQYTLRGTSGELCLTGDLVANGYHKRPDAKGFVEDFGGRKMYRTGDRVRLMADGSFEFLGRNDDQIKIRGQRIELGEVSEAVRAGAAKVMKVNIVEAAAIVVQHPTIARPQLVAFVAAQDNGRRIKGISPELIGFPSASTAEEIRTYCSNSLPAFMVPDHVIRLTSLPLVSISRKVDNKELKALFTKTSFAELTAPLPGKQKFPHHRPMSDAEKAIRSLAADVLAVGQETIDVDTNLFRLGLDSLNIISLTIKLQKVGIMSTVSNIMNNASVEQIAVLPRNEHTSAGCTTVKGIQALEQRYRARSDNGSEPSNMATIRPCLPLQETLVASSLNHEGEALYVNHVILKISPDVDPKELIQAWTTTAEDHEILRTCFREFDNRYVQIVLKSSPLSCERINTSSADSRLSYLRQRAPDIASEIIDCIESKPPIRLTLAASHSGQQEYLLMISIHHSLYDAESFSMLLDDVHGRYEKHTKSTDHTPVTALIDYIASRGLQDTKAFWTRYLGGYRSCLLPSRSADHSSESISRELATPLSKLESLAASLNGTPASLVQALFGVVLAERLGANDIVFGTILSGRTVPVENAHTILAPCITTIPQRVHLRSNSNNSNLVYVVKTAQRGFVETIEYQHTALRDIHRWVQAEKPLFDTLFSYTRKQKAAPWSQLWQEVECSMPNEFPLAIEMIAHQVADQIRARLDFTTAFGTAEQANSLLDRLEQLMRSLLLGENLALRLATHHENGAPTELTNIEWTKLKLHMRDVIAEIVELRTEEITKDASFFALGVDSIIAIQFAKRLRQYDIQCSSADVMRHSSISQLAQHIESQQDSSAAKGSYERESDLEESTEAQDKSDALATYHCTPLQSSMLTQTLGADESLYVHHHAIRLSASFDASKMSKAWADLVAATEILRTSFHFSEQTGSWSGIVNEPSYVIIHEHDPSSNLEQVLTRIKEGLVFREAADFAKPPWAINIVGRVYILSLHHSLYDGESLSRLFGDLSSLLKGDRIPRRPLYSEAALAIYERTAEAEDYWARKLIDFNGSSANSSRHKFRELRGTLELDYAAVLQGCRTLGVTLQTASLLAYGKTLATLSRQQDVVFGHVMRGRTVIQDADEVVGPLFNTVPVRINLEGTTLSNGDAAKRLQHSTGECQGFQHASLSRVQQAWREKTKSPEAELLDALFVFRKLSTVDENWPWTSIEIDDDAAPTEYSTNLEVEQRLDKIAICVNSSTVGDLDEFVRIFENMLRDILEHPEDSATASLGDISTFEANTPNRKSTYLTVEREKSIATNDHVDAVRKLLAKVSGISEAHITSEASIFTLGLDSISAIQIAQVGRKDGLKITVADVLQGRTVIGISQRLQQETSSEVKTEIEPNDHAKSENQSSHTSDVQPSTRSEVLASTGLRDEDVENILPCLPGQVYHLTAWLQSGRTLGEGTFTYACKQALDPDRLLDAWHTLRVRHAMLRTVFTATGGATAVQIVLKPSAIRSDAFDYIALSEVDGGGITHVVKQEACRRFDLFAPPVGLVLERGRDRDYLILRLHHALYDAWTVPVLLDDLMKLYQNRDLEEIDITMHAKSILEITRSATTTSSQEYWRKILENHQPTILRSGTKPDQAALQPTFHFHKMTIANLHALEEKCQRHSISLPTLILLAIARVLARYTAVLHPVFGLYQAGRSSASSSLSNESSSTIPYLNMTPLLVRNASSEEDEGEGAQMMKQRVESIQEDLAARVSFEQTFLRDILDWADAEGGKLRCNTFVNILWEKPHPHTDSPTSAPTPSPSLPHDKLLTPWTPPNGNIEEIPPCYRAPGKTAVDGLDVSVLEDGKLFLDVQRDERGGCVKLFGRCDGGVLSAVEVEGFLRDVGVEVRRCVETFEEGK